MRRFVPTDAEARRRRQGACFTRGTRENFLTPGNGLKGGGHGRGLRRAADALPVLLPVILTGSDILTMNVYNMYIICTIFRMKSSAPNLHWNHNAL